MLAIRHAAFAYLRTLWLGRRLRSRTDIERHQAHALRSLVEDAGRHVAFYRQLGAERLSEMPIVDKAIHRARFADFNRPGVTIDEIASALASGKDQVRGHFVGQSTGTSGNRGYYVIIEAERFAWLGTILAKALPDALLKRHRLALALPGLSALYRAAPQASRIAIAFFDLGLGVDAWLDAFKRFAPDTVVAPPKALRRLGEAGVLRDVECFSAAEVLDLLDRRAIERTSGRKLREIYMATEGLFGVSCPHGTLHLAEDVVHFEWQPIEGSRLVAPLVTDLVRRVQPMVRYRMNDLLELDPEPCACGSPLQAVRCIEGRLDDAFEFPGSDGRSRLVTPDVLRNAVVDADRRIDDFRVVQTAPDAVVVRLPKGLDDAGPKVAAALGKALARLGVASISISVEYGIDTPFDRKLRRVVRAIPPTG